MILISDRLLVSFSFISPLPHFHPCLEFLQSCFWKGWVKNSFPGRFAMFFQCSGMCLSHAEPLVFLAGIHAKCRYNNYAAIEVARCTLSSVASVKPLMVALLKIAAKSLAISGLFSPGDAEWVAGGVSISLGTSTGFLRTLPTLRSPPPLTKRPTCGLTGKRLLRGLPLFLRTILSSKEPPCLLKSITAPC